MRLSRIITALVAGLAVAGAPTAAGAAQPYPPQPPGLTVTPTTVAVGAQSTWIAVGFGANELVRFDFAFTPTAARAPGAESAEQHTGGMGAMAPAALQLPTKQAIPSSTARADGSGRATVVKRFSDPGQVLGTATGLTTGRTASASLIVVRAQPGLPVTGSDLSQPMMLGGGLLAVGVLLVLLTVVWRRRNRRDETTLGSAR